MLTQRDRQILESLTWRVKAFSIVQIARTWWPQSNQSRKVAARRLSYLKDSGYLQRVSIMARPVQEMEEPLTSWKVGQDVPNMGALSYQLKQRWNVAPEPMRVYLASRKTVQMFGGKMIKWRMDERSHDLVLAEVFLFKFQDFFQGKGGETPDDWISESLIRQKRQMHNQKLPDALLRPSTAIEVGGRYDKHKLESFHAYCEENQMHYEIW